MATSSESRFSLVPRLVRSVPWWASALIAAGAIVLGVLLITRPVSSLGVLGLYIGLSIVLTGIGDAVDASRSETPRAGLAAAIAWILFGVLILVWLGGALDLLVIAIGAGLIGGGVVRVARAFRGTVDQRIATGILGVADVVFGALALAWPDVTLIIVAVLFGARTVFFGVRTLWRALARRTGDARTDAPTPGGGRLRRFGRVVAAVLALIVAIALAGVGAQLRSGAPVADTFAVWTSGVPTAPGVLLRAEPFDRTVPEGAVAWRILYSTTDALGEPALSSGLVMTRADDIDEPRPVIAWAHGTTGFDRACAPTNLPDVLASGAMPAVQQVIDEGWHLVATDYTGLGTDGPHPYLIGPGEAHSVVDAVRAAGQLDDVNLAPETVVWGHSQGGHAALWTGQIAPDYAPELDIVGVAAMSPASDLIGLIRGLESVTGGSLFGAYVAAAYEAHYDDVTFRDILEPGAERITRELAARCLEDPRTLLSIFQALAIEQDRPIFRGDPTAGAFGDRLRENTPVGPESIPLLLTQGSVDPLVLPSVQQAFADRRCAAGLDVDYRVYEGFEHVDVVLGPDSPLPSELVAWTQQRFAGESATSSC